MAVPISQYVLKIHSRCDLACNHCYVYKHADQSWRGRPRAISAETVEMAARRIAQHANDHGLPEVCVVLHGGEPLLLGKDRTRGVLDTLTSWISPVTSLDLRIHSNGVLLDEQWCELFRDYRVKVGISLDGDETANDRHRRFADGRSSYPHVLNALALLRQPEYRRLYAGILCTIDIVNDPIMVYQALLAEAPPNVDLLLPHATWENPPMRRFGTDYADWLLQVYRRWTLDGRPMPIRFFDSLLSAARGGPSFTEALGTDPSDLLVIETDGSWEQPDSMKTAFDGAAATGTSVFHHTVDEAAGHAAIAARQHDAAALCVTCRTCPVVRVCGGGLYAHRFRRGSGFDNPSVYCADLKKLISEVLAAEKPGAPGDGRILRAAPPAPRNRPVHELDERMLDVLAAGPGDLAAISTLGAMRLSQTRSLVAMAARAERPWRAPELRAAAAEGWALLCQLDIDHPQAVRDIFEHPYTCAWALRCLRPPAGADVDLDRAHLAGLAAAAALRAGVEVELPLPIRDGLLHVPTAGAVAACAAAGRTEVVWVRSGRQPEARGGGDWWRARYVTGTPFRRLALEDLDPFRDCQEWPATSRLPVPEWLAWERGLVTAGRHLTGVVPAYAQVLGEGLRAVVPLRPVATGSRSATARQAFGALAAALPGEPGELSVLLLHEFQHVKLNALLDLHPGLFDPDYSGRLRVPWRDDERPVEGVFHGVYAFLALCHLHRSEGGNARPRYLRYRSWAYDTAAALLRLRHVLTADGQRFVAGMAEAASR